MCQLRYDASIQHNEFVIYIYINLLLRGAVMIFTLQCTFPHSCLYLPPVAGRSLYLFISFNYYLLLTQEQQCTVCLLMHSLLSYAQHTYLRAAILYSI